MIEFLSSKKNKTIIRLYMIYEDSDSRWGFFLTPRKNITFFTSPNQSFTANQNGS